MEKLARRFEVRQSAEANESPRLVDCNSRIRSGQDAMRGIVIGALDRLALRLWCRMWGVKPDADEAQGLRRAPPASNPDGARPGHPITR